MGPRWAALGVVLALSACGGAAPSAPAGGRTPSASPTASPSPSPPASLVTLPSSAEVDPAPGGVVWVLLADRFLFRSTDRGGTWEQRTLPSLVGQPRISFVSASEGWLNAGGSPATQCQAEWVVLYHTVDGGATWTRLPATGLAPGMCKEGISFVDSRRGFLSAWDDNHQPVVYHTSDGGQSWSASAPLPDPPGFTTQAGGFALRPGLVAAFGSELLVAASSGRGEEYVFRSLDAGRSWSPVAQEPGPGWSNAALVTATRWIAIGPPHEMQETTDAGASWHTVSTDYSQAAPIPPTVSFGDPLTGYATVRGGISRTLDGGAHWTGIRTPGT